MAVFVETILSLFSEQCTKWNSDPEILMVFIFCRCVTGV